MADKYEFKVNYVKVTEEGLEKYNDVRFDDLTHEDRQDIKSLVFLPIDSGVMWDITNMMKDFPFLENLYLPSMMTTEIKDLEKECPMLKTLVMLSHNSIVESMDHSAVRVYAGEEGGDNITDFRSFVENDKKGNKTFYINTEHVSSHERVEKGKNITRLTLKYIKEIVSGDTGILKNIEIINDSLSDEKYRIDLSKETLESLFQIFVEKGVTFEEFTIDFSKMCDKIESYKALSRNVNQVSIKEDIETNIVETYQRILQLHFNGVIEKLAERTEKLIAGTTIETENLLIPDLKTYIVNALVDHPSFDEDYKSGNILDTILLDMSTAVARNIKSSRIRGLARKYIAEVVSQFKNDRNALIALIETRLKNHADVETISQVFAEDLDLDLKKKQPAKFASEIVDILTTKNLGTITKDDVKGILDSLEKKMGKEELRPKEILAMLTEIVSDYPTREEINDVLVDFIEKNGYKAIKLN